MVTYEDSLKYFAVNNDMEYLLDEFSMKNEKQTNEISYGSTYKVWWNCPKCLSEYDMRTYFRTKKKCNCPYCSGKRVNNTNSLSANFPEIAKEWNYIKNENLTPNTVTHSSSKKVWWICENKHEWKVPISNRTTNGSCCPYCSGRRVGKENNFEVTHPDLCKDWDYDKNNIDPSNISWSYKKVVWWKCNNGHKYKKTVYDKVRSTECPHCHSIAFQRPDLMKEWDYKKNNVNPYDISVSSGKKVYWKCSNCDEHIWLASPHKRNVGRGCPVCNESQGEKEIRKWLNYYNINFIPQKEFNGLIGLGGGNLSYDFYLPVQNILIEYQGEFHDGTAKKQTKIEFEIQKEHDKRKKEFVKQNGIKLLEIWYWEFNSVKEIINNIIGEI